MNCLRLISVMCLYIYWVYTLYSVYYQEMTWETYSLTLAHKRTNTHTPSHTQSFNLSAHTAVVVLTPTTVDACILGYRAVYLRGMILILCLNTEGFFA